MKGLSRSIVAIAAGLATVAVLGGITAGAAHLLLPEAKGLQRFTLAVPYFMSGLAGAYVTGRLASRRPRLHVVGLVIALAAGWLAASAWTNWAMLVWLPWMPDVFSVLIGTTFGQNLNEGKTTDQPEMIADALEPRAGVDAILAQRRAEKRKGA